MSSAASIHKLFFFLSLLFGTETPLVSKESEVLIDREAKTGRISYRQLHVEKQNTVDLDQILEELDGKEGFDDEVKGLQLTMSVLRSKEGDLAVEVFFRYEKEEAMLQAFGFEDVKDHGFRFESAEEDSVLSSNGRMENGRLVWPSDAKRLRLKLSGEPENTGEQQEMVKVKYVKR